MIVTGLEKVKFCLQFQRNGNAKECSNCQKIVGISHAIEVMLKNLEVRPDSPILRLTEDSLAP